MDQTANTFLDSVREGSLSFLDHEGAVICLPCVVTAHDLPSVDLELQVDDPGEGPVNWNQEQLPDECLLHLIRGNHLACLLLAITDSQTGEGQWRGVVVETFVKEQQRRYFRVQTSLLVEAKYFNPEFVKGGSGVITGTSINLSGGGVLASFPLPLREDTGIRLSIDLSGHKQGTVTCLARVVRLGPRQDSYETALQFTDIQESAQDRIIQFCLAEQRRQLRSRVRLAGH